MIKFIEISANLENDNDIINVIHSLGFTKGKCRN